MTLRMVFERADLQRVRMASAPDPMWELVLSLHQVRERRIADRFAPWQQNVRHRLRRSAQAPRWLSTLFTLVPPDGKFPDFLTPAPSVTEVGAGCEAVACTPRGLLPSDLGAVFAGRRVPGWVRALATGDREQLNGVVAAVRQAHDLLVAPSWHAVRDTVAADRVTRRRTLSDDGVGGLLAGVPGVVRWDGEVLELHYPETRTVHLAGRGLTLVPSYFCSSRPVTLIDPELPPVLIYPATAGQDAPPPMDDASRRLVPLLGRTRADCLAFLTTPHTTTALAANVRTSIGTASKQATVLREAGLISSERRGNAVLHHLTHLGEAMLRGDLRQS